jgi:hypothetical protein
MGGEWSSSSSDRENTAVRLPEGWVGSKTNVDVREYRKISRPTGTGTPTRPAPSLAATLAPRNGLRSA